MNVLTDEGTIGGLFIFVLLPLTTLARSFILLVSFVFVFGDVGRCCKVWYDRVELVVTEDCDDGDSDGCCWDDDVGVDIDDPLYNDFLAFLVP